MKAKVVKKKSHTIHEVNTQAIFGFIIIATAFGIYYIFNSYQDNILHSDMFYPLMFLVGLAMAFLLWLFYLASKPVSSKKKK